MDSDRLNHKNLFPITIIIPVKNDFENLKLCLPKLDWANEVLVVDSQSTDSTVELAESHNVDVIQFNYKGGWPKKRQWVLDNYPIRNDWILLLDADEILLPPVIAEIKEVVQSNKYNGYFINFEIHFLNRQLKYGNTNLWKLSLFRYGKGKYEKRLEKQYNSMGDIEVHEHVVVDGEVGRLKNPILHRNINSLSRYILKHDAYSNWEAGVILSGEESEIQPNIIGNQAQRRRKLKSLFINSPIYPILIFLYGYIFCLGFLDGKPGFIYQGLRATYSFHIQAKVYEKNQC